MPTASVLLDLILNIADRVSDSFSLINVLLKRNILFSEVVYYSYCFALTSRILSTFHSLNDLFYFQNINDTIQRVGSIFDARSYCDQCSSADSTMLSIKTNNKSSPVVNIVLCWLLVKVLMETGFKRKT